MCRRQRRERIRVCVERDTERQEEGAGRVDAMQCADPDTHVQRTLSSRPCNRSPRAKVRLILGHRASRRVGRNRE